MAEADFARYPRHLDAADQLAEYLRLRPEELLMTPGSDAAVRLVCASFARTAGASALLIHPRPHYAGWEQCARLHGFTVQGIETDPDRTAELGPRLVAAAQASRGALMAVSIPGGPAGGCLTAEELAQLAETARERDHLLVLDACYQAFNGPLREQLARRGGPVLVIQSLSKSHALAGARIAVVCGDPELVAGLGGGSLEQAVSAPALLAAEVAIGHHELFRSIWAEIAAVRQHVAGRLAEHGFTTVPSRANFLATRVGTATAAAEATRALSAAGYRIRDLSDLPRLAGHVRFTLADRATTDHLVDLLLDAACAVAEQEGER